MDVHINSYERVDDLNRNGYRVIQDPKRFCFGIDAVLLSAFTEVRKDETVLDLGTGTGIIPILLAAKTLGKKFIGIEIQEESVEMARRSVILNNLSGKVDIHIGDIKELGYKPSSFNVITANPPYIVSGRGLVNESGPKAIARHEILCSLEDIIKCASRLLVTNGRFYMVHRPDRLVDIMHYMREYKLEPKKLRLVQPYADSAPVLVLIKGKHRANIELKVLPPLVIHKADGTYTDEVHNIYWG